MIFRKRNKQKKDIKTNQDAAPEAPMLHLTEEAIKLGMRAQNKEDAIRQVADCLIDLQKIEAPYKDAMLAREKEVSTYLVNGVAIPHGVRNSLDAIKENAVFIGQFPEGVVWNDSENNEHQVYLVCALASRGSAHLGILNKLTMLIQNKESVLQLAKADSLEPFFAVFSSEESDN